MTDAPEQTALLTEEPSCQPHRGEPQVRDCLRCHVAFHSEWAGERICGRCKSSAAWRGGLPVRAASSNAKR